MLPTLAGRIQTRIFMLTVLGGLITLLITPLLPHDPSYASTFGVLVAVMALGVAWEFVYHGIQQFRWEKDWPTLFGLLTAVNEGSLTLVLLRDRLVPWVEDVVPTSTFVIMFLVIWMAVWIWVNGPMRVPMIRWRFHGGRFV